MKLISILFISLLVVSVLLNTGCKNDSEEPTPPTVPSAYLGTFASANESGILTLTITGKTTTGTIDSMRGTMRVLLPGTATIAVAGSMRNDTLAANGGGFRLSGASTGFRLSGSFVNLSSNVGGFATQISTNNEGTIYCGTYRSQVAGGEDGTFNVVITGVSVTGIAISATGQNPTVLNGSVVGTVVNIPNVGAAVVSGDSITGGTFAFGSNHGVWSARVCR